MSCACCILIFQVRHHQSRDIRPEHVREVGSDAVTDCEAVAWAVVKSTGQSESVQKTNCGVKDMVCSYPIRVNGRVWVNVVCTGVILSHTQLGELRAQFQREVAINGRGTRKKRLNAPA